MNTLFFSQKRRQLSGALVGIAGSMAFLAGCSHPTRSSSGAPTSPASLLVAVDRSESTRPLRTNFFDQMDYATAMAISQDLPLDVWAYDRNALRVYGPRKPLSHTDLDDVKASELAPNDAHLRRITRPAVLLEGWVHDRAVHPAFGTYAVILTDGDAEVAEDEPRLVKAAVALGNDPSFRMAVLDIKPEDRKMWDNALTKGMPGRYVLAGPAEAKTALEQFLQGKVNQ